MSTSKMRGLTNKTRRKVGGKKIGQGVYGSVYSPPLKCTDGSEFDFISDEFVSKTVIKSVAYKEFNNSQMVRILDPDEQWFLTVRHICELAEEQTNTNFRRNKESRKVLRNKKGEPLQARTVQLILKNGGQPLISLLEKPGVVYNTKDYTHNVVLDYEWSKLPLVIKCIKNIIPGLDILNKKYIHNDLHFGNIVYDGSTSHIIDFGFLETIDNSIDDITEYLNSFLPRANDNENTTKHFNNEFMKSLIQITDDIKLIELISTLLVKKDSSGIIMKTLRSSIYKYVLSTDLRRVFEILEDLFQNKGCKEAFPGIYDGFINIKPKPIGRKGYIDLIMRLPE